MLNDPHKNIFYYYRGPSKREKEDIIYDTQIEDNTTKALINCFDYSGNELLKYFIDYFNLMFKYSSKPQYLLQVSKPKSRPDAQIKSIDKSIYFENKISSKLDIHQLIRHKESISKNDILIVITYDKKDKSVANSLKLKHLEWKDIHKCFKEYEPKDEKERFIINQFTEYLEVIGLSDFTGFTNNDFDYFINRIDDYKPIVRNKLEKFSYKVINALSDEIKTIYTDRHIGIIPKKPETIWFGIRKDQKIKDKFKHCNFTIEIDSEALNFYTVIRDGKYNQNKPIGIFYKKIKNNFDEFLNTLKSISGNYYFRISKRVPRRGNKIMPGNERWVPLSVLTLEFVTDETIDYILMLLKKVEFPGIHMGLSIKRGDEILKKPELLIEKGKKVIEEEYKVLKFLES